MGQLVDELKPKYESKINFIVVNLDDPKEQPVGDKYNPQYVPMTVLYDKNGSEKDRLTGVVDKAVLEKDLTEISQ